MRLDLRDAVTGRRSRNDPLTHSLSDDVCMDERREEQMILCCNNVVVNDCRMAAGAKSLNH